MFSEEITMFLIRILLYLIMLGKLLSAGAKLMQPAFRSVTHHQQQPLSILKMYDALTQSNKLPVEPFQCGSFEHSNSEFDRVH